MSQGSPDLQRLHLAPMSAVEHLMGWCSLCTEQNYQI